MTDPVYLKLKEDAGVVLKDLWRVICPVRKHGQLGELRLAAAGQRRHPKSSPRR